MIVITGAHLLLDRNPKINEKFKNCPLIPYSQGILWIYVLTSILGYRIKDLLFKIFQLDYSGALVALSLVMIFNVVAGYYLGRLISRRKCSRSS